MNNCLIVDGHEECRIWMGELVREVFPEMGILCADSFDTARSVIANYPVSMALLDIALPDGSGGALVCYLRKIAPHISVAVMTFFEDDRHLFEAIRAGAQGYLLKSQPKTQVLAQLEAMKEGVLPLAPSIARRVLAILGQDQMPAQKQKMPDGILSRLTEREQQVLDLIVRGETVKELSAQLGIAPCTTAGYVRNIYEKLEVSNRAGVVAKVMRAGG